MASFIVTARKTSPVSPLTIEAESRELAIQQVIDTAAEGEEIEVLQCTEALAGAPAGATGTSSKK